MPPVSETTNHGQDQACWSRTQCYYQRCRYLTCVASRGKYERESFLVQHTIRGAFQGSIKFVLSFGKVRTQALFEKQQRVKEMAYLRPFCWEPISLRIASGCRIRGSTPPKKNPLVERGLGMGDMWGMVSLLGGAMVVQIAICAESSTTPGCQAHSAMAGLPNSAGYFHRTDP